MPEILEVEAYRRAAEAVIGRQIATVAVPDPWYVKGSPPAAISEALVGRCIGGVRRHGKLLLFDTTGSGARGRSPRAGDPGPTLGVRFGMTGRLVVDGTAPIGRLLYAPVETNPVYERFALTFCGNDGDLRVVDPRRLGGVQLDPDEGRLGPDALSITPSELGGALGAGTGSLKGRLLDQERVAGIGNLLADEILWRAGLAPNRAAGSLGPAERRRLYRGIRDTLTLLGRRGGSHTGDLMAQRMPGGVCPRDGAPLRHATVAGRTSWWCPAHQA